MSASDSHVSFFLSSSTLFTLTEHMVVVAEERLTAENSPFSHDCSFVGHTASAKLFSSCFSLVQASDLLPREPSFQSRFFLPATSCLPFQNPIFRKDPPRSWYVTLALKTSSAILCRTASPSYNGIFFWTQLNHISCSLAHDHQFVLCPDFSELLSTASTAYRLIA